MSESSSLPPSASPSREELLHALDCAIAEALYGYLANQLRWLRSQIEAGMLEDSRRLDTLDDLIIGAMGRRFCLVDSVRDSVFYVESYGSGEIRRALDDHAASLHPGEPT